MSGDKSIGHHNDQYILNDSLLNGGSSNWFTEQLLDVESNPSKNSEDVEGGKSEKSLEENENRNFDEISENSKIQRICHIDFSRARRSVRQRSLTMIRN